METGGGVPRSFSGFLCGPKEPWNASRGEDEMHRSLRRVPCLDTRTTHETSPEIQKEEQGDIRACVQDKLWSVAQP